MPSGSGNTNTHVQWSWLPLLVALVAAPVAAQDGPALATGPAKGALVIVGGGRNGPEIMKRFMELAGGNKARIVILPGAGDQDTFPPNWSGLRSWKEAGAEEVTVLHTRDPKVADTEDFVKPLKGATAVWIPGGRQWKLTIVYNNTRTLKELHAVLERGGVIGGSSAGASVQSSYMVRGAEAGNDLMMAEHSEGFGFLRNSAVDQHILARGRQNDLKEVVAAHPELLGIGIDESTAIVVQGHRAEVVGESLVAFHNTADGNGLPYFFLKPGDVFDLAERRVISGIPLPPEAGDRRMVLGTLDRFFNAMRAADSAAVRRVLHADARIFVTEPAGQRSRVQSVTTADFLKTVVTATNRLDRRITDPEIRVDGNLASVWARYYLYQGGKLVECGTDSYDMARIAQSGWRILQMAYTKKSASCN
jgi:cyanophycinase